MDTTREAFEKIVFDRHFFSTIEHTGLGQCMEFMPNPQKVLNKSVLLARDGDSYKRKDVSAMWFGWLQAIKWMEGKRNNE